VDPKLVHPGHVSLGRLSLTEYRLQPTSLAKASGKFVENQGGRDFAGGPVPSCRKTDRGAFQSDDCKATDKATDSKPGK
jgi:hypothetical protein